MKVVNNNRERTTVLKDAILLPFELLLISEYVCTDQPLYSICSFHSKFMPPMARASGIR